MPDASSFEGEHIPFDQNQGMPRTTQLIHEPAVRKQQEEYLPFLEHPAPSSGRLLQEGRYHLVEAQERRPWIPYGFEVWWAARARERNGARVSICEVMLNTTHVVRQTMLQTAIKAFLAIQGSPHLPALEDVFSEGAMPSSSLPLLSEIRSPPSCSVPGDDYQSKRSLPAVCISRRPWRCSRANRCPWSMASSRPNIWSRSQADHRGYSPILQ